MKKIIMILCLALTFVFPLGVNAGYLGYGDLNVVASGPTSGGFPSYYLDYDGSVISSNFGYTFTNKEVFCVSSQEGSGGNYDFYTITSSLSNYAKLSQAAWIADNWTTWGTDDITKGEAQKAVWKIMGIMDLVGASGKDLAMYNAAKLINNYVTSNWLFAYSPSMTYPCGRNYQDFLTPYTPPPNHPTPEPSSILLFGLGLFALAGIDRKIK
ncbi:MAG TPA: PEP-CTERM sorting domain-containing protein [Candidatus Goldiibacteriota bacterium]|nr:PEP-CTERM sorting domain-containing protein [Candidatus Goldiibacteriota bacterium]